MMEHTITIKVKINPDGSTESQHIYPGELRVTVVISLLEKSVNNLKEKLIETGKHIVTADMSFENACSVIDNVLISDFVE